jgi:HEAT repeat protein
MSDVTLLADLVLAAGLVALVGGIVLRRMVAARRRRRVAAVRRRIERAIARFLVDEDGPPIAVSQPLELRTLRDVALEVLLEVRGRERERLTELLEQAGVVQASMRRLRGARAAARRQAADDLAVIGSATAVDTLLQALDDDDGTVRVVAARALVELGDPSLVPRVLPVVAAEVDAQPAAVAELLLSLGVRAPQAVGEALRSTRSPEVRRLAATVIGELRLAEQAPALRQVLREGGELAAVAARGLGMIGDADAVEDLAELAADAGGPESLRAAAMRALGRIGEPRVVGLLGRTLRAPEASWPLRQAAAEALAKLGVGGRHALEAALEAGGEDARRHAAVALGA